MFGCDQLEKVDDKSYCHSSVGPELCRRQTEETVDNRDVQEEKSCSCKKYPPGRVDSGANAEEKEPALHLLRMSIWLIRGQAQSLLCNCCRAGAKPST